MYVSSGRLMPTLTPIPATAYRTQQRPLHVPVGTEAAVHGGGLSVAQRVSAQHGCFRPAHFASSRGGRGLCGLGLSSSPCAHGFEGEPYGSICVTESVLSAIYAPAHFGRLLPGPPRHHVWAWAALPVHMVLGSAPYGSMHAYTNLGFGCSATFLTLMLQLRGRWIISFGPRILRSISSQL